MNRPSIAATLSAGLRRVKAAVLAPLKRFT
jgi:hypothetical protein